MPRVPDEILDCVFYLYPSEMSARTGDQFGGTGFLVGVASDVNPGYMFFYAVTNSHVIREGKSLVMRFNTADGDTEILASSAQHWFHHPDGDDVAICPVWLNPEKYKFRLIGSDSFVTKERIEQVKMGPGDEVFMVGRFINHEGRQRNQPTIRTGIISMMPGEHIYHPTRGIEQESYLIETHSIPGYSGSPVFIMFLKGTPRYGFEGYATSTGGPWLVGIDWCHLDDWQHVRYRNEPDNPPVDDNWGVRSNTGMMGVVPSWKLTALLNSKDVVAIRKDIDTQIAENRKKQA